MIAAVAPGMGNPLHLDLEDFNAVLRQAGFLSRFARGEIGDREALRYEEGLIG